MTSEFTIAVHSLVFLFHHMGQIYSSEALAKNVCTNPARIRKVMAKLKKSSLIETKEGADGGYKAAKTSGKTALSEVAKSLEITFIASSWKSGNSDLNCMIASGMGDVMMGLCEELNSMCYERLEKITIEDVDKKLTSR